MNEQSLDAAQILCSLPQRIRVVATFPSLQELYRNQDRKDALREIEASW